MTELGVESAQDNAVFIYDLLAHKDCLEMFNKSSLTATADSQSTTIIDSTSDNDSNMVSAFTPVMLEQRCKNYFERISARKWIQLANMGHLKAIRKVAEMSLHKEVPVVNRATNATNESVTTSNNQSSVIIPQNSTRAALLYAYAGERGDYQSILSLGWMARAGTLGGTRNLTLAEQLFDLALQAEWSSADRGSGGVAPLVAKVFVWLEKTADHLNSVYRYIFVA